MDLETRSLIHSLIGMDCFGWSAFRPVFDHAGALVDSSKDDTDGQISKEFDHRVEHVEHHSADDEGAYVIEPVCVYVCVEAAKHLVDQWDLTFTAVPWRQNVNKTIIEQIHVENGQHSEVSLLCQIPEPDFLADVDEKHSDPSRIDDNKVGKASAVERKEWEIGDVWLVESVAHRFRDFFASSIFFVDPETLINIF